MPRKAGMTSPAAGQSQQKCCFAQPGGPWPRNYALNAAANGNIANEIVTIKVGTGEAQTSFQWLRSILEFHSSFFTGALERSFKEAQSREIEMPQDNPDVFAEFVRWITDHRLGGFGADSDNPHLEATSYFDLFVRLYVFAGKYLIPRLQNVVVDAIIVTFAECDTFLPAESTTYLFDNTPDDSPLRNLVVDFLVLSYDHVPLHFREMSEQGTPHCQIFTQLVFARYVERWSGKARSGAELKGRSTWKNVNRCEYHVAEVKRD